METELWEFVSLAFRTSITCLLRTPLIFKKELLILKILASLPSCALTRPAQDKLPVPLYFFPKESLVSKRKGK